MVNQQWASKPKNIKPTLNNFRLLLFPPLYGHSTQPPAAKNGGDPLGVDNRLSLGHAPARGRPPPPPAPWQARHSPSELSSPASVAGSPEYRVSSSKNILFSPRTRLARWFVKPLIVMNIKIRWRHCPFVLFYSYSSSWGILWTDLNCVYWLDTRNIFTYCVLIVCRIILCVFTENAKVP